MECYDVLVIGGGPAGLAAALSAKENNASTLIVEREARPGGILKQCIHDGFGLIQFKEKLSGPEYAERFIKMVKEADIKILTSTFVIKVEEAENRFVVTLVNSESAVFQISSKTLVLANGCRERTSKQIFINGTRPAGILTAGTAQFFVNIAGYLPCKKCIILGSGDIGLIMARRLKLEGAEVLGVYEAKPSPSGLTRNIVQCLNDYSIPLYLSKTITRVFGTDRIEAAEIVSLDENMNPIKGTEETIKCDGIILSVGLIPENEISEALEIALDSSTKGPYVDENFMTLKEGVFSCGNALHVNDLVDYVSESGKLAGANAAKYSKDNLSRELIPIKAPKDDFLYVVPQFINKTADGEVVIYFRSKDIRENTSVTIRCGSKILYNKNYLKIKPPEMERIKLDLSGVDIKNEQFIELIMA